MPAQLCPKGETRAAVLDFVKGTIATSGYPPTIREIMAGCGIASTQTAHYHLTTLEAEGKIARSANGNRTIRVITEPGCCPACGRPREVAP